MWGSRINSYESYLKDLFLYPMEGWGPVNPVNATLLLYCCPIIYCYLHLVYAFEIVLLELQCARNPLQSLLQVISPFSKLQCFEVQLQQQEKTGKKLDCNRFFCNQQLQFSLSEIKKPKKPKKKPVLTSCNNHNIDLVNMHILSLF